MLRVRHGHPEEASLRTQTLQWPPSELKLSSGLQARQGKMETSSGTRSASSHHISPSQVLQHVQEGQHKKQPASEEVCSIGRAVCGILC